MQMVAGSSPADPTHIFNEIQVRPGSGPGLCDSISTRRPKWAFPFDLSSSQLSAQPIDPYLLFSVRTYAIRSGTCSGVIFVRCWVSGSPAMTAGIFRLPFRITFRSSSSDFFWT